MKHSPGLKDGSYLKHMGEGWGKLHNVIYMYTNMYIYNVMPKLQCLILTNFYRHNVSEQESVFISGNISTNYLKYTLGLKMYMFA